MSTRDDAVGLWDREAETFDEAADHGLHDPAVRAAWRELLRGVLPPAPARVADLGCGTATLGVLLGEEGYAVDGVDFSPAMVERARAKVADSGLAGLTVAEGDAGDPPLPDASYDVVLCRHVLWALPDQPAALDRWRRMLVPGGHLVLVEGHWGTGAGLTGEQTTSLLRAQGLQPELRALVDAAYWGREIDDERYLVTARVG
jgi:ubiquinone/menaquinone biosynthesis C-methylase UbiE